MGPVEFVSGGYFLTKLVSRPAYNSTSLLPPRILSVSRCIAETVPGAWAIEWASFSDEEREEEAARWQIGPGILPQVLEWTTRRLEEGEMGWPDVFLSASIARQFVEQFLPVTDDLVLVGIGLPLAFADEFTAEEEPSGVRRAVGDGKKLESDGRVLGFEILGYESGGFHSWLCNSVEGDVFKALGVRPGDWGLVQGIDEARSCASYVSTEDVGAEPVSWRPWLLNEYGLLRSLSGRLQRGNELERH